jgi:hypothetical protein
VLERRRVPRRWRSRRPMGDTLLVNTSGQACGAGLLNNLLYDPLKDFISVAPLTSQLYVTVAGKLAGRHHYSLRAGCGCEIEAGSAEVRLHRDRHRITLGSKFNLEAGIKAVHVPARPRRGDRRHDRQKLVLPSCQPRTGIIGEIRVPPPQNLLLKWRSQTGCGFQSVNRVFGLTLCAGRIMPRTPQLKWSVSDKGGESARRTIGLGRPALGNEFFAASGRRHGVLRCVAGSHLFHRLVNRFQVRFVDLLPRRANVKHKRNLLP